MVHRSLKTAWLAAALASLVSAPALGEPSDNPFAGMAKVSLFVAGTSETCVSVAPVDGKAMALDAYGVVELESTQSGKARCIARGGFATGTLDTEERVPDGFAAVRETYAVGTVIRYLLRGKEFIGRQRIFDAKRPFCAFAPRDGFSEPQAAFGLSSFNCADARAHPGRTYVVILLLRVREDRSEPSIVPAESYSVGMAVFTTDSRGALRQVE